MSERDPRNAAEALARAGDHARRAATELARAAGALLDAAALASTGRPAGRDPAFAPLAALLADLERALAPPGAGGDVASEVLAALGAEIARWEGRAEDDAEARAVLRMLLGLRELLWEAGLRAERDAPGDARRADAPRRQHAWHE